MTEQGNDVGGHSVSHYGPHVRCSQTEQSRASDNGGT